MDLLELGDMGCEDENCNLGSGFQENCSNHECQWEEPVFGLVELVCVTVVYIPLMLFGLLGNLLTILVVWLRPHMRSSTYLYLSSMAVSDLLILLLLPLDLYKLWRPRPWPLGDLACKLTMFLSECCTFCTILHITFLSLERYLAVCWPITAKTLVTRRRTRALIGCLWLGAAASAAPVLVMVGVEDVGGEEVGLGGWREGGGWTGREGEQSGFVIGGREIGDGHIALMDEGLEGITWEEKEKKSWGEKLEELKWFGEKEERELGIREQDERKQGDEEGGEEEGKVEVEGKQQNKLKEDEGGGQEDGVDGGRGGGSDKRECRCTHYAVSSGLLSGMMILSNLYFLVPLCILGLVYSLIGRTLWLRPQSSRRDQSHKHTVKMLGVIVLAFVLCWLPFHVGRTIFSLSLGSDRQETYADTNSHFDIVSDVSVDGNTHTFATPISRSDALFEDHPMTGEKAAQTFCDMQCICANTNIISVDMADLADAETETHTDMGTRSDELSFSHIISRTRGQHINTDANTHDQDPSMETDMHTAAPVDTQLDGSADSSNANSGTNTTTHNETHKITHAIEKASHSNASFHAHAHANTRTNKRCCIDAHTPTGVKNWTTFCMNSQNAPNHSPPTAVTNTHAVTSTDTYSDNPHYYTPFNNTYTHPDTHLYFLYYLSQYFNLVSSVLFYLSAAVNPLLYNLMSARYRHAVHSLVHAHSRAQPHRLGTSTGRHSTTTL